MGLPIQATPKYTTMLPASGREVEYRPFLVKEQKILVLARESEDSNQIMKAIKDLIESVTDGKVNADDLPMVDMEWLFLKIRSVSVGETAQIVLPCEQEGCSGSGDVTVNLEKVAPQGKMPDDATIMITDTVGVKLSIPSVGMLSNIKATTPEEQAIEVLKKSLLQVFDEDSVYHCNELSDDEITDFIEGMTFGQLQTLGEFFDDLPRLVYDAKYKCESCGTVNEKSLEGLQSFF